MKNQKDTAIIELPTWLGDSVMTTPALENILKNKKAIRIVLIGNNLVLEVFREHPNISEFHTLKKDLFSIFKLARRLPEASYFLSFRGSFRSTILKFLIRAKYKAQFDKSKYLEKHQVEKYNLFSNEFFNIQTEPSNLKIYHERSSNANKEKKIIGINPGASYGSAKRWYPEKFAMVVKYLSPKYTVKIFGGPNEIDISNDIENFLIKFNVLDYENLAGKLSVKGLIREISNLDLMITGDSGPMHIAAAFQVPTVAIFGPTRYVETSQWMNSKKIILSKELPCQPCMKRHCPLGHHDCMNKINASDVTRAVEELI